MTLGPSLIGRREREDKGDASAPGGSTTRCGRDYLPQAMGPAIARTSASDRTSGDGCACVARGDGKPRLVTSTGRITYQGRRAVRGARPLYQAENPRGCRPASVGLEPPRLLQE